MARKQIAPGIVAQLPDPSDVDTDASTVLPLPDTMRDMMRRHLNKGLMVFWINQNLYTRAGNDVRKSLVFYDADGTFETAIPDTGQRDLSIWPELLQKLYEQTAIRYWSKGI